MEQNEKALIDGLFDRLRQAEQQTGPREAQAETAIRDALARQPAAPYYMTQAILIQEHALKSLNERVQQLEQELRNRPAAGASSGGFLAGLFGGGSQPQPQQRLAVPPMPPQQPNPFQQAPRSSFLGGAMQMAMGVAGGMLLGSAISSLFSSEAQAAELLPTDIPAEPSALDQDFGADFGGDDDESFL